MQYNTYIIQSQFADITRISAAAVFITIKSIWFYNSTKRESKMLLIKYCIKPEI